MVVAFDNTVLCLLLHPEAKVPNDPSTGKPIDRAQDRMSYLVEQLRELEARILIPAPVLSEFLTYASPDYLAEINRSAYFEVAPFDQRAAIEAAAVLRKALKSGKGKKQGLKADWQKIKVDRQIVAIAKVGGADRIYTTDDDIAKLAPGSGLIPVHVADLPLPPSNTPLLDTAQESDEVPTSSSAGRSVKTPSLRSPQSPDDESV